MDAVSVRVQAPTDSSQRIAYLSTLEAIEIQPGDAPARVIVNSRTGTVVIGSAVRVTPAAVAHGSLSVTITERNDVSQPNPLSQGETVVTPRTEIKVEQPEARMFVFQAGVNLDEIVRAVNQVGAAPGDLVAILEASERSRRTARRAHRDLGLMTAPTNINFFADFQGLAALKNDAKQQAPAALKEAARQFESLFTQMLLKSMREANKGFGEDSMFGSDQADMYQDMFDDQMAFADVEGQGPRSRRDAGSAVARWVAQYSADRSECCADRRSC